MTETKTSAGQLADRLENRAEDLRQTAMNGRDSRFIKLLEQSAAALRSLVPCFDKTEVAAPPSEICNKSLTPPNASHLTTTTFEEVKCDKSGDGCGWPECDCPRKGGPKGTFACPICGESTPHHHSLEREKRAECSGCMNPACGDCFEPNTSPVSRPEAKPTFDNTTDETAWLIELAGNNGVPNYYQLEYDDEWTPDANKALRFARREDARAYIDHIGWTEPRLVERMWCSVSRPEAKPAFDNTTEPVAWQYRVMRDKGSQWENEWCDWRDTSKKYYDKVAEDIDAGATRVEVRALAVVSLPHHRQGEK